jgi:hypothetical protein
MFVLSQGNGYNETKANINSNTSYAQALFTSMGIHFYLSTFSQASLA